METAEEELGEKEKSIEKAHAIIRKLNDDYEKAIRDIQKLENMLERTNGEKRDLQKVLKELRSEIRSAENSKKTEERLRLENAKCREEMFELAKLTKDDQERITSEFEELHSANEEYKFIIGQLEGKLGELEKLLSERNTSLQEQEAKVQKLSKEAEDKSQEVTRLQKQLEEILADKDAEMEGVKKIASDSMRCFYANLSQSAEAFSTIHDVNNVSAKHRAKQGEQELSELVKPWMEAITMECMSQIESELEKNGEMISLIESQNESLVQSDLNTRQLRQRLISHHEGMQMRIEDLESQLVETIRRNKALLKMIKGYSLTIEALEQQLKQYKNVLRDVKELSFGRLMLEISDKSDKEVQSVFECVKRAEAVLSKVANQKVSRDARTSDLSLMKTHLEREIEELTIKGRTVAERLSQAQTELSQIEEMVLPGSKTRSSDCVSRRVEGVFTAIQKLKDGFAATVQQLNDKSRAIERENMELKEDIRKYSRSMKDAAAELTECKEILRSKQELCQTLESKIRDEDKMCTLKLEGSRRELGIVKTRLEAELRAQTEANTKLKEDYERLLATHSEQKFHTDHSSRQVHELVVEKDELLRKLFHAENHAKSLEEQINIIHRENIELASQANKTEQLYKKEHDQCSQANLAIKSEFKELDMKNKELTLNLQYSTNECKQLKQELERLREQSFRDSKREESSEKCSTSKTTLDEDLKTIKERALKMPASDRLEYYECVIETLVYKRQRTKRSCEKRINEFECILRLIEATVKAAAGGRKHKAQNATKLSHMEGQVFGMIQSNSVLTGFLHELLSVIDKLTI